MTCEGLERRKKEEEKHKTVQPREKVGQNQQNIDSHPPQPSNYFFTKAFSTFHCLSRTIFQAVRFARSLCFAILVCTFCFKHLRCETKSLFIISRQTYASWNLGIFHLSYTSLRKGSTKKVALKAFSEKRRHDDMKFVKISGKSCTFLPRL